MFYLSINLSISFFVLFKFQFTYAWKCCSQVYYNKINNPASEWIYRCWSADKCFECLLRFVPWMTYILPWTYCSKTIHDPVLRSQEINKQKEKEKEIRKCEKKCLPHCCQSRKALGNCQTKRRWWMSRTSDRKYSESPHSRWVDRTQSRPWPYQLD